ncbi:MAG: hypothetical protein KC505_08585 [Myxococcales bacterium]|nr:hypothetical protein [Myxococcales bacterium]USN50595.1 MAG: hypothetical protein H6731_10085 [Myxococcales bacterium]
MIFFLIFFLFIGCSPIKNDSRSTFTQVLAKNNFLDTSVLDINSGYFINVKKSNIYKKISGCYPNAIFLQDYPKSGILKQDSYPFLAIKLPISFYDVLPNSVQKQISMEKISKDFIDIFIVGQSLSTLGEKEDHKDQDSSQYTTGIMSHTWLDTDAPLNFDGTRLLTRVDIGVFENQFDVSYENEIKVGALKDFEVHIHDSVLSPRTAKIKIDSNKSQYFYSVVIDKINKENKRTAITLHLLLNSDDEAKYWDVFDKAPLNLRELLNKLRMSSLKEQIPIIKLLDLFKER